MTATADLAGALTTEDADRIAQLAELLAARSIDYLEVSAGGTSVFVARQTGSGRAPGAANPAPASTVTSPAVGVFHPASSGPDAVAQGSTLGHIQKLDEAVPVLAPHAGRVAGLCVPAGSFVEFGQTLLRLETP